MSVNKIGKKAAGVAAAAALAAGILLGGSFDTKDELLDKNDKMIPTPPAVVELLEVQPEPEDDGEPETVQEEKRKSLRERIRCAVLRLPYWLRAVLCLPLWCVGQIAIYAAGLLWSTLLSPIAKAVLPWLCFALITAAVTFTALKFLFPELKLKDVFCKRNMIILIVGTVLIAIACICLDASQAQTWTKMLAKTIGSTVIIAAISLPLIIKCMSRKNGTLEIIPAGGT